ncbi:hypothetical protein ACJMK2_024711 [Sinanodonta woodiana]|uniref:Chitin-binding type-2 domain-containing protein n=1 Tax=Sinanodonta woodiana TaxID=1069815 RepID=A0ABD3XE77_SINWO
MLFLSFLACDKTCHLYFSVSLSFIFAILYPTATSNKLCVSSCVGKINGDYQYCPDCRKYVACSNGYKHIMPCPAKLVWDDNLKRCEWMSSTCPGSTTARTTISVCETSCVGKIYGEYQYCPDCRKYVACSNGNKYIMPCPANLVWDDNLKRCELTSSTCPGSTTSSTPITGKYDVAKRFDFLLFCMVERHF